MFVRDVLRIDPGKYLAWTARARSVAQRAIPALRPRDRVRYPLRDTAPVVPQPAPLVGLALETDTGGRRHLRVHVADRVG